MLYFGALPEISSWSRKTWPTGPEICHDSAAGNLAEVQALTAATVDDTEIC
ncbi:hypothetical protein ACU635_37470 [[Actinomadura] parvosata]|uniref:hypothetical protein n=1 Tax=[Actinomadura] parvosata TaxID=1955412 RepID=UPI00406C2AA4